MDPTPSQLSSLSPTWGVVSSPHLPGHELALLRLVRDRRSGGTPGVEGQGGRLIKSGRPPKEVELVSHHQSSLLINFSSARALARALPRTLARACRHSQAPRARARPGVRASCTHAPASAQHRAPVVPPCAPRAQTRNAADTQPRARSCNDASPRAHTQPGPVAEARAHRRASTPTVLTHI